MQEPTPSTPATSSELEPEFVDLHILYRFYDAEDRLLYVGITFDIRRRWRSHSKDKPWWRDSVRSTMEHFGSREEALAAEAAAIKAEQPIWNVVHNRRPDPPARLARNEFGVTKNMARSCVPADKAEIEARLNQGMWLQVGELMVLFDAYRSAVDKWFREGPKITGRPLRYRLTDTALPMREANPDDVAEMLMETRKIRSAHYPNGIPGQFVA